MANGGFFMNLAGLGSGLSSLGDLVTGPAAEKQMQQATLELQSEIQSRAPVDTGHLRASYEARVDTQGNDVIGRVGTNTEYAVFQEYAGTPHVRPAIDAKGSDIVRSLGENTLKDAMGHL